MEPADVMSDGIRHSWDLTPREAIALQRELAGRVVLRALPRNFRILGASDIGYVKAGERLAAVMLTFSWPDLLPLEAVHAICPVRFPYIPGLLSFREIPPLIEAFEQLKKRPDVLLCDGQGIAHPRKFGLAAHLGLYLGLPTIGCAKKRLCGIHASPPNKKGCSVPLYLDREAVGSVYCSRDNVKPIFVSPGHLCDQKSAERLVARCLGRYRIPEPLRQAHLLATKLRLEISISSNG
ncbi:endonuclease V [Syntrophobacter fumaroxidans]|nr:endonuclease V [Syntrophobacter fumaroxidans]